MIKPYKVKHIPTGLYYQPHKYGGSHLSKRGKIYQTKLNGVFDSYTIKSGNVRVSCEKDSTIHKDTKDKLVWNAGSWSYGQLNANTNLSDWIIEEII